VFHRNGKKIKSFRRAFISAAKHAGLAGLTPHDLRRSAVRNFLKVGLDESEGISISGHETNSTYKRYGIIDENLQRQSLERGTSSNSEKSRSTRLSRSGEPDELGQNSDKRTGKRLKDKVDLCRINSKLAMKETGVTLC
jgi:hypothetical protein